MAKIIKKGKDLEKKYIYLKKLVNHKLLLSLLTFCVSIISGIYFFNIAGATLLLLSLVLVIISIALLYSTVPLKNEMDILKSGIDGEYLTNRCIATLPESYTAFRNLTVFYKGKSSEIDILVIGPTGLFVIETKNSNGHIYGNINDAHWTQYKVGQGGTPYSKTFYNPVKQVNTHVYRIANYLKEKDIRTYINPIVYFSNINTVVEVSETDEKTPVFFARNDGENQMLFHILNNNQQLSQDVYDKIKDLLIKI